MNPRAALGAIFDAGVYAVKGRQAVARELAEMADFAPDYIISVGKAAGDMCLGGLDIYPGCPALVVTKYGHTSDELAKLGNVRVIESAHPVPDENSILAGRALLEAVAGLPNDAQLLVLVSGGASALAEVPIAGKSLSDLQELSASLVASGAAIGVINQQRMNLSQIKDGRLLAAFSGAKLVVCAISDVEGDSINTIGSGIADPSRSVAPSTVHLVATNAVARQGCADKATALGFCICANSERLYADVFELADQLGDDLKNGPSGLYIWGGEPTIILPDTPGVGGRNQALALALAGKISGTDGLTVLVAGTDGTDGPNDAAGAIVDGSSAGSGAAEALILADAGSYLRQTGDVLFTGPTGTNVMDLVLALKI